MIFELYTFCKMYLRLMCRFGKSESNDFKIYRVSDLKFLI